MKQCSYIECSNLLEDETRKYCSLPCSYKQMGINKRKTGPRYMLVCSNVKCGKNFGSDKSTNKYCSRSCAASVNNTLYPKRGLDLNGKLKQKTNCFRKNCSNEIPEKRVYCSRNCRNQDNIERWLSGEIDGNWAHGIKDFVRKYVLERAGYRCEGTDSRIESRCTETRILQVDHISGDWTDSSEINLRALCPTCHALTDTYGAKNKGNGRSWKKNYSQFTPKLTASES